MKTYRIKLLPLIDIQVDADANRKYWEDSYANAVRDFNNAIRGRSLEDECATFYSLAERGVVCLREGFRLRMTNAHEEFALLSRHTELLFREAIKQRKYAGYRRAWGIDPPFDEEGLTRYHLQGAMECHWYLYALGLLNGNPLQEELQASWQYAQEYAAHLKHSRHGLSLKDFFDKYWFIWTIAIRQSPYCRLVEEYLGPELNRATGQIRDIYTVTRHVQGDDSIARRAGQIISRRCKWALSWYDPRRSYPWWHSLPYGHVLAFEYLKCDTVDEMLSVLKGVGYD